MTPRPEIRRGAYVGFAARQVGRAWRIVTPAGEHAAALRDPDGESERRAAPYVHAAGLAPCWLVHPSGAWRVQVWAGGAVGRVEANIRPTTDPGGAGDFGRHACADLARRYLKCPTCGTPDGHATPAHAADAGRSCWRRCATCATVYAFDVVGPADVLDPTPLRVAAPGERLGDAVRLRAVGAPCSHEHGRDASALDMARHFRAP